LAVVGEQLVGVAGDTSRPPLDSVPSEGQVVSPGEADGGQRQRHHPPHSALGYRPPAPEARQAVAFDIADVVQSYLDVQESNDRAAKTMVKNRDVLNRFAALAAEEW
jgi:hypothetical protein